MRGYLGVRTLKTRHSWGITSKKIGNFAMRSIRARFTCATSYSHIKEFGRAFGIKPMVAHKRLNCDEPRCWKATARNGITNCSCANTESIGHFFTPNGVCKIKGCYHDWTISTFCGFYQYHNLWFAKKFTNCESNRYERYKSSDAILPNWPAISGHSDCRVDDVPKGMGRKAFLWCHPIQQLGKGDTQNNRRWSGAPLSSLRSHVGLHIPRYSLRHIGKNQKRSLRATSHVFDDMIQRNIQLLSNFDHSIQTQINFPHNLPQKSQHINSNKMRTLKPYVKTVKAAHKRLDEFSNMQTSLKLTPAHKT